MTDRLSPRQPHRPLTWPDMLFDLQGLVAEESMPVYIVGGAVRDALLQRPVTDIDLAVPLDAVKLARRIANIFVGDVFVMDSDRDVGRALIDTAAGRYKVDVARFRGDGLLADLQDRDFTINAMAVEMPGDMAALIDPMNGEQDLRDKLLRRCHAQSLADDPIRALRAVRQSVQLGLRIEPQTLKDLQAAVPQLKTVSAERIRDEFFRLLSLPNVRQALRVAEALGLLVEVLPELSGQRAQAAQNVDFPNAWQETLAVVEAMAHVLLAISPARSDHTAASFGLGMLVMQMDPFRRSLQVHVGQYWPNERPHQALLVLVALLYKTDSTQIPALTAALRLSNDERDRLLTVLSAPAIHLEPELLSPLDLHRFWWRHGEAGVDICLLTAARWLGEAGSHIDQDAWLAVIEHLRLLLHTYYERYDEIVSPPALLDGGDLMAALALKSGPVVGELLQRIREAQVVGEVHSKDDALVLAREYLRQLKPGG